MRSYPRHSRRSAPAAILALTLTTFASANAQQHAHTHGHMQLDVAVDTHSLTLQIESPLDNFLGIERAPRNDAERQRVSDMVARLNAADELFHPDPSAGCKLSKVDIHAAVLGLPGADAAEHDHDHGHGHDDAAHADADDEHADIDVSVVFACAQASSARFIDVKLFEAFDNIRSIDVQVASPQGQFKRSLRPNATRLEWGR